MKRYLVQFSQERDPAGGWKPMGVLVGDGNEVIPVAVGSGGARWEEEQKASIQFWPGTPRELMLRLVDQNGLNTAYTRPSEVSAETPQLAAEKLFSRMALGFTR